MRRARRELNKTVEELDQNTSCTLENVEDGNAEKKDTQSSIESSTYLNGSVNRYASKADILIENHVHQASLQS